jgi:hypothetical protein
MEAQEFQLNLPPNSVCIHISQDALGTDLADHNLHLPFVPILIELYNSRCDSLCNICPSLDLSF